MPIIAQVLVCFPFVLNSKLTHKKPLKIILHVIQQIITQCEEEWQAIRDFYFSLTSQGNMKKVWYSSKTKFISHLYQYLLCVSFFSFFSSSLVQSACFIYVVFFPNLLLLELFPQHKQGYQLPPMLLHRSSFQKRVHCHWSFSSFGLLSVSFSSTKWYLNLSQVEMYLWVTLHITS